jgi:signal transduction histidine kinase
MSCCAPAVAVGQPIQPAGAWPRHDGNAQEQPSPASPRLLAELSHDLRSPLASLRLLVDCLSDGVLSVRQRDGYLAQMATQISVLTAMVDDLHAVSRFEAGDRAGAFEAGDRAGAFEAGDRAGAFEAVDPRRLVERALEMMRIQATAAGVVLELDAPAPLPVICANPLQLHRMLVNLIENAIRHTDEGGSVILRAHPARGSLVIEVEDEGDGIPAADAERVFTAFYGGDRAGSAARSGLGLAMARATIAAHGGHICVAACSRGTRLRISLPVAPSRVTASSDTRQSRELEHAGGRSDRIRRRHSHARAGQF